MESAELSPEEEAILIEAPGDSVDEEGIIDFSKLGLITPDPEKLIEESIDDSW
jgi:hypothetical protein